MKLKKIGDNMTIIRSPPARGRGLKLTHMSASGMTRGSRPPHGGVD